MVQCNLMEKEILAQYNVNSICASEFC